MKALLDKDGLDRNPHNMKNGWYYENKGGLEVYCPSFSNGGGSYGQRNYSLAFNQGITKTKRYI